MPLRELSLEQLASLEVTTVAKQPSEVWRTPAAITVITQEDIRRSGVTTLPELLRLVGGVQVSRQDSDHWAIGIRGLTNAFSKALLVLIDGRTVYTPLFGGVYWQVQETLLEDVERIEVIRGPGGTIWGSNAVNGVINVITKHSRNTSGLFVTAGTGNVDQGRVGVRYGATRGDNLSYRFYATGSLRDGQYQPDGNRYDEWSLAQGGFRIDFSRRPNERLQVQGDLYKGTMGERVAVGSYAPPAQLLIAGNDPVSGGNVVARWERDALAGSDLRLQAYFDRTVRRAVHFGETRDTFDADLLVRTPIGGRQQLSWGAGARISPSDFTPVYSTVSMTPEDRNQHLVSLFAQNEVEVFPDELFVTVGTKLEHNVFTGWEFQPSARAIWRLDDQESVWASVTRAVRRPSRIESDLRLTGFLGDLPPLLYALVAGSEAFDAERLVGFEVGYRRLIGPSFYVDVAAFHNKYDGLSSLSNFVPSVPLTPLPHVLATFTYENGIDATGDGFEISPDWRPRPWARLRGHYSFLTINATNRPGSVDTSNVLLYEGSVPRHQGAVRASFTLPGRVELDYAHRAVSRLPVGDVPRYVTGDARVAWDPAPGITLAAAGQNLFAPRHVEFYRTEFPPSGIRRSVYVSLTWRR